MYTNQHVICKKVDHVDLILLYTSGLFLLLLGPYLEGNWIISPCSSIIIISQSWILIEILQLALQREKTLMFHSFCWSLQLLSVNNWYIFCFCHLKRYTFEIQILFQSRHLSNMRQLYHVLYVIHVTIKTYSHGWHTLVIDFILPRALTCLTILYHLLRYWNSWDC